MSPLVTVSPHALDKLLNLAKPQFCSTKVDITIWIGYPVAFAFIIKKKHLV